MKTEVKSRKKFFGRSVFATIILLVIQYALGVNVAMYVNVPSNLPHGNAWGWVFAHSPVTIAHVIVGTLLLLVSLTLVIGAIRMRKAFELIASILGFFAILIAWRGGVLFLSAGQEDTNSFIMRMGFAASLFIYSVLLYYVKSSVVKYKGGNE
jgi:hypothetical protein